MIWTVKSFIKSERD